MLQSNVVAVVYGADSIQFGLDATDPLSIQYKFINGKELHSLWHQ